MQELSDEDFVEDDNNDDIDYEPEFIEQDDASSDSEQSLFENSDLPTGDDVSDDDYFFYVGKDGETLWISNCAALNTTRRRTSAKNIVKIFPGPKGSAKNTPTPFDAFSKMIAPDMIERIVKYTNIYIMKTLTLNVELRAEKGEEPRQRDFKPTSRNELMALIGVLFLLAIKKGNRADVVEHWQSDGTGLVILRANFSYRRFLFLLRSLRLDDVTDRKDRGKTDKLAAVREFQSDFVKNCQNSYSMGEFVTIDEMLVPFRGRCGFVQYMPQKPAKYGLKYYALCDSKTFYTYSLELYCGKQHDGPYGNNSNKPTDIVKRLVEPIEKSNRNLTTDNYYTSFPLAEHLLQVGLTLLGTMKRNKREIPPEFISEKNRQVGSSLSGFQNDMSLVSYVTKKKKCVIILSTMHDTMEIDPDTHKPEPIMDYNSTKGGVDSVDQMCSTYSTSRKTRRWTMTVFFRILDIAGINSYKIYLANNLQNNIRRKEYLKILAISLMKEHWKERAQLWGLPKDVLSFLSDYKKSNVQINQNIPKKYCYLCGSHKNNRTHTACEKCHKNVCKNHRQSRTECSKCIEEDSS